MLFNNSEEHSRLLSLVNLRFYNLTRLQDKVKDSLVRLGEATTRGIVSSQHQQGLPGNQINVTGGYNLARMVIKMKNSFAKLGPACQPLQSRDKRVYQREFEYREPTRRGFSNTEVGNSNKKKKDINLFDHLK